MTVETLKEAIIGLAEDERHSLAAWINELDYDAWDKEMAKDFSPEGRGAHLIEKVKREIAEGKARPMEEGFAQLRKRFGDSGGVDVHLVLDRPTERICQDS
jgi:hypothetical protein